MGKGLDVTLVIDTACFDDFKITFLAHSQPAS